MRARMTLTAILFLSAMGAAGAQSARSAAADGTFQISGTAVNAVGGQPVGQARISLINVNFSESLPSFFVAGSTSDRSVLQAVTTGESGRFSFTGLPAGRYSLIAECRGFYRQNLDAHDN